MNFNFVINYQSRKFHVKTNSLIRRSENQFISDENNKQKQQLQTILTSNRLNDDVRREVTIKEMKNFTSAHAVAVDNLLFDKIIVSEEKQLALIKKTHD